MRQRLAITCLLLLVTAAVHGEDWPEWRGKGRLGIWNETGILDAFPDGGWREQRVTWLRAEVSEGAFRMRTVVNRQQFVVRDVGLDPTADFDIELTVETTGGNEDWPVGLVWGYENRANFLEYLIWMDGRLRIDRNASLTTEHLTETVRTQDLVTGPATNALKLSRRGQRLRYYVNGTEQGELPFSEAIGPSVGFVIWAEIDARFDDLVVTQY